MQSKPPSHGRTIIRLERRCAPYVTIDKTIFNDARLSYAAKGVHGYLLGKPDDWKVRVKDIAAHATDGTHAVTTALNELRRYGYARLVRHRDHLGRVIECVWTIYETPATSGDEPGQHDDDGPAVADHTLFERAEPQYLPKNPQPDFPEVDNPEVDDPVLENCPVLSNEFTNERRTNERATKIPRAPAVGKPAPGVSKSPTACPAAVVGDVPEGSKSKPRHRVGAPFPVELSPVRELLTRHGFPRPEAEQLVLEFGDERVRVSVGNLEWYTMNGRGRRNPRGYLIAALRDGYQLIEGVEPAKTHEEIDEGRERIRLERLSASDPHSFDREMEAAIERRLSKLDDAGWARALAAIDSQIPDVLRPRLQRVGARNVLAIRSMVNRYLEDTPSSVAGNG